MRHGSLFSGIGGFDLASQWMGWENVFHCEWMDFPRKILEYYWPDAESFTDITKTDFTKYENTIDIISGGFPCQPFSMAGKRKGKEDERYLWDEMLRAIREIKPKFVVAENVSGLVSIDEGMVLNKVITDLETEGYETQSFIIPACSINAPHRRDRIYIIGFKLNATNTECERLEGYDRQRKGCTEHRGNEGVFFGTENKFNATNTHGNGFEQCDNTYVESTTVPWINALCHSHESNGNGVTSNTTSKRSGELEEENTSGKDRQPNNNSEVGNQGIDTNTHGDRLQGSVQPKSTHKQRRSGQKNTSSEYLHSYGEPNLQGQRWGNFPAQSPVCSRNDGISDRLDDITFSKWRAESIKGYGNAVVPQVVYELFKIIEELNNTQK